MLTNIARKFFAYPAWATTPIGFAFAFYISGNGWIWGTIGMAGYTLLLWCLMKTELKRIKFEEAKNDPTL